MSKRWKLSRRASKKQFSRTAAKSKAININPITYRGGIRL